MTDIPVKRGTTGAEGEEKKLKGEWGMKDAEPLAGEASWTLPLSFTANHQTGSKAGMLQRESHSIWVGGDRGKWGGGRQLETLKNRLEEGREQGQPLRLLLPSQAQAGMAPSQPHNPTGLCREESPPGTPIAVTRTERRAHIDTGASVSVIVRQPGKLLQCAIPSSRTAQQWQQAWGGLCCCQRDGKSPGSDGRGQEPTATCCVLAQVPVS